MKLTFEQLKRGAKSNLKDCLIMEYRMVQHVMNGHDFFEGVRAGKVQIRFFFRLKRTFYSLHYSLGR